MIKKIIFFFLLLIPFTFSSAKNTVENLKIGNENSKITINVFSSLTCPHCANFHKKIFKELKREYIDTDKVKFVHYGFPLDLAALNAEKILRCKINSTKKFEMLNEIYEKQSEWAVGSDIKKINESLKKIGKNFDLSNEDMNKCLKDEEIETKILNERISAQKNYEISSTPTIYINEKKYEGQHEYQKFKNELEKFF